MLAPVVAIALAPVAHDSPLFGLAPGTPAWIAETPDMEATIAFAKSAKLSITVFTPRGASRQQWLINHIDTIDLHHNQSSQFPPYNFIMVFGLPYSPALEPALQENGFVRSKPEPFGFTASKSGRTQASASEAPP
jgi:hypothetical protein